MTGNFTGTADFGRLSLTSADNRDIFVWKTDPSGNSAWVRRAGGESSVGANRITVGANGDLFVSGTFFSVTADFGTDQLTSAVNWDGFFWNLDTAGNHVAAWRMGGTGSDHADGSVLDEAGNAYLTGGYRNTADFPTGDVLTVSGGGAMFIMKFSAGPPEPGIAITPTSPAETTEGGGTATFEVTLTTAPLSGETVTVTVSSNDTSEGTAAPSPLIFDEFNWDTAQVVTVTGQDDPDLDGDIAYAVDLVASSSDPAYNGLTNAVSLTNLDDETPAVLDVTGILPNSMLKGTTINVTITGSGFQAGASVVFENFAGPDPTASNVVVVDSTTITADVAVGTNGPNKNRVGDVRVTNPGSATDSLVDGFTVTVSAGVSATSAASESAAASLDDSMSDDASADDAALVSIAAPLPATDTGSISSTESEPAAATTDDSDAVDEALADFAADSPDDALLEDLAVALVG